MEASQRRDWPWTGKAVETNVASGDETPDQSRVLAEQDVIAREEDAYDPGGEVDKLPVSIQEDVLRIIHQKQDVDRQLDSMLIEGLQLLDQIRSSFESSMQRVRAEFDGYNEAQLAQWTQLSDESKEARQRLEQVRGIVAQFSSAAMPTNRT